MKKKRESAENEQSFTFCDYYSRGVDSTQHNDIYLSHSQCTKQPLIWIPSRFIRLSRNPILIHHCSVIEFFYLISYAFIYSRSHTSLKQHYIHRQSRGSFHRVLTHCLSHSLFCIVASMMTHLHTMIWLAVGNCVHKKIMTNMFVHDGKKSMVKSYHSNHVLSLPRSLSTLDRDVIARAEIFRARKTALHKFAGENLSLFILISTHRTAENKNTLKFSTTKSLCSRSAKKYNKKKFFTIILNKASEAREDMEPWTSRFIIACFPIDVD